MQATGWEDILDVGEEILWQGRPTPTPACVKRTTW